MTDTMTNAVMIADQLIADHRAMLRIRVLEERVRDLRLAGDIVGSVHLCIGQEAGPVGAVDALGLDDGLFATYRGHGWALARGVPPAALLAEMLGRATGVSSGRGGSAYFSAPEFGFHGENSIVGGGVPIAAGAALAGRHDGSDRVSLAVVGDGALNQGAVHEAMNFAAAMRLPLVLVCENNGWSELTAIEEMVGEPELWRRGAAYGIAAERVDGNDPAAVRRAVGAAVGRGRAGEGPTLLELMTARLVGHYIGDAETYRRAGELDRARENEPLVRTRRALLAAGRGEDLDRVEAEVSTEIDQATEAALAAPLADVHAVGDHVYA